MRKLTEKETGLTKKMVEGKTTEEPEMRIPDYLKYQDEEGMTDTGIAPKRIKWTLWLKKTKKPYIMVKLIFPNGRILSKFIILNSKGFFKGMGKAYAINREAIYMEKVGTKIRPVSYYFWEHPDPIKFDLKRPSSDVETASSFKELLETKVVQEMAQATPNWIFLLLIIIMVGIAAINLIILYKVMKLGA